MEDRKEKYRVLSETEKSICIYIQPWWLDIDCGKESWDVLLSERNGCIVGALPFYVKQKKGLKYVTIPPMTQHHGVWIASTGEKEYSKRQAFEQEVMEDLIIQLESEVRKNKIVFYNQTFSPTITDWLPFYWKGYNQTTRYTYRIEDISDMNQVYSRFQRDKKKNIKKAVNQGIQIMEDLQPKMFYEFHKKCLCKQGKKIRYSYEMLEKYYSGLYAHNAGKCLYAIDENGNLIGALLNAYDSRWGYDWISAFDRDYRDSGVSDYLVYSMMNYLSDKTCGYDFEGSMDAGIGRSFRHFGGVQYPYFHIYKVYSKRPIIRFLVNRKLNATLLHSDK